MYVMLTEIAAVKWTQILDVWTASSTKNDCSTGSPGWGLGGTEVGVGVAEGVAEGATVSNMSSNMSSCASAEGNTWGDKLKLSQAKWPHNKTPRTTHPDHTQRQAKWTTSSPFLWILVQLRTCITFHCSYNVSLHTNRGFGWSCDRVMIGIGISLRVSNFHEFEFHSDIKSEYTTRSWLLIQSYYMWLKIKIK